MDHPLQAPAIPAQASPDPADIWMEPASRLLSRLQTTEAGLDAATARSRLAEYGPNDAAAEKRLPLALQFLTRFRNPLVIILLIASALSAATGDVASFVVITAIVVLSITFDFVQEVRAQSAVEALRRSVAVQASVRRDGRSAPLPIDQLVPGDIVELIAGNLVPADCRLLESRDLTINQALLTGEPYPAEKHASDTAPGAESPMDASNAVFAGTSVISGTATVLVCRTGAARALGHLAASLAAAAPVGGDGSTPAKPKKVLIIVTDGMADYGARRIPDSEGPFKPADCNAIKALGYMVYVLCTPYSSNPSALLFNGQLLQYLTGSPSVMDTSLQQCASDPGNFKDASAPSDVIAALNQLPASAIGSAGRFTH